jgi:hypothetical protein
VRFSCAASATNISTTKANATTLPFGQGYLAYKAATGVQNTLKDMKEQQQQQSQRRRSAVNK